MRLLSDNGREFDGEFRQGLTTMARSMELLLLLLTIKTGLSEEEEPGRELLKRLLNLRLRRHVVKSTN